MRMRIISTMILKDNCNSSQRFMCKEADNVSLPKVIHRYVIQRGSLCFPRFHAFLLIFTSIPLFPYTYSLLFHPRRGGLLCQHKNRCMGNPQRKGPHRLVIYICASSKQSFFKSSGVQLTYSVQVRATTTGLFIRSYIAEAAQQPKTAAVL